MTDNAGILTGVFEVCMGVPDLDEAIAHWRSFGFAPIADGQLDDASAAALYGAPSGLQSVRLGHGKADSGLIRLMQWDQPSGDGLGLAPLRSTGCRWSVQRTEDLMLLWNHVEVLVARGATIGTTGPEINARVTGNAATSHPLKEAFPASRNLQLFQPHYQQVVMQRFNIDVSAYGGIDPDCLFRTTELCHMAVVTRDRASVNFYAEALGFRKGSELTIGHNPDSVATKMFDLQPQEELTEINFENPRSGEAPNEILAGRLRVFYLNSEAPEQDLRERAQFGQLGYCGYTGLVPDITHAHNILSDLETPPTLVQYNEFDEDSFAFYAPDGYAWALINRPAK